jgi:hypothetical protein
MTTVRIPDWNPQGLLPPNDSVDPTSAERSPYTVALTDFVLHFGTTKERQTILQGLLGFRAVLHAAGLNNGFQWVDGNKRRDGQSRTPESSRVRSQTMNIQEKHQLLAEKTALERMLAGLPESSVIDRMSLQARKAEVEKALAAACPFLIHEEEKSLSGHFLGVLPHRRTFEYEVAETQGIIAGKVGPDIENAGSINQLIGHDITIQVHSKRAGTGRPRYTLLSYKETETMENSAKNYD